MGRLLAQGSRMLFRGLRTGDVPLFAFGFLLVFVRRARASRRKKLTSLTLRAGQSAALRVTRGGADPVTYRIDA